MAEQIDYLDWSEADSSSLNSSTDSDDTEEGNFWGDYMEEEIYPHDIFFPMEQIPSPLYCSETLDPETVQPELVFTLNPTPEPIRPKRPRKERRVREDNRWTRFTAEEDERLIQLVNLHGARWSVIGYYMKTRNARQCRERWDTYLNPSRVLSAWTPTENYILYEAHRIYGNKWSLISNSYLPQRSAMAIKNRWRSFEIQIRNGQLYF